MRKLRQETISSMVQIYWPSVSKEGLSKRSYFCWGYKRDPVGILRLCTDMAVSLLVHKYVPEVYTASGCRVFSE